MPTVWKPNGSLDVATEATDLPESSDGRNTVSEAFTVLKNFRVDRTGVIEVRDGASVLGTFSGTDKATKIVEQGGNRYTFAGANIYRDESSIASGLTSGAVWSAMQYNPFNSTTQSIYALNGTDRKRIEGTTVSEWGSDAPTTAPALGGGLGSTLTGAYNVQYTYVRKEDTTVVYETDPSSAASAAFTLASEDLGIGVSFPTDTQITHIRVYRTQAGGSSYLRDTAIDIATDDYSYAFSWEASGGYISGTGLKYTTSGTYQYIFDWEADVTDSTLSDSEVHSLLPWIWIISSTADSGLGSAAATDHDRPPSTGTFTFGPNYNGTCFICNGNLLHYCLPKQPEYWPTNYFIEVSTPQFPLQTGVFFNGQPYVMTKNDIYNIQGTGHQTFFPFKMEALTGAQGPQAAYPVHGQGIYHVGFDGIYLFTNSVDTKMTQTRFEPIFRGETTNGIPGASDLSKSWIIVHKNQIYFGYTSSGYTYPTNILVMNFDDARTAYFSYDTEISTVAIDETNNRVLAADTSGNIWHLEDSTVTTDNGTAISYAAQSKDFTLQTRAHFPRWVKWDVTVTSGTCTGELLLNGTSQQSHSITGTRDTRKRLVTVGNGQRAALKLSGSGKVKFYAAEFE